MLLHIGIKRAPRFACWASGMDNRLCIIVVRRFEFHTVS